MSEPTFDYAAGHDGNTVRALFAPADLSMPPAPAPAPTLALAPAPRWTWTARTTVVALATAAAVFVAAAAALGALYAAAGGDRAAAAQSLTERRGELAGISDRLAATESDRQGAQQRNSALVAENAGLTACVNAVQHRLWDNLSDAQQLDAVRVIFDKCQ